MVSDVRETPVIEVARLNKSYGSHQVLRDVSLTVMNTEVVTILGPSGAGKSTLLRCVNVLERPDSGLVVVDGELMGLRVEGGQLREISDRQLRTQRLATGMVFQRFNLYQNLSVLRNVSEGARFVRKMSKRDAEQYAKELLDSVGMADRCSSFPAQLSGGQQQRVAIARALATQPKVLLFDEPTSALDPEMVGEVLSVIQRLGADGTTMMIVTHEIGFARQVADRVVFMTDGEIVETGSAREIFDNPQQERTRSFLSKVRS